MPTFSTEDFVVRRDGMAIAATASVPSSPHAKPAVVILHGGGNSSRADSPPYRFWGEYFARNGYVAVTYDKRGNGQSTGAWQTVGFSERADDVLALVAWLRMRPDVDPDRVSFFSVSQGTWVATLAAARDRRIRLLVQVSSTSLRRSIDTCQSTVRDVTPALDALGWCDGRCGIVVDSSTDHVRRQ